MAGALELSASRLQAAMKKILQGTIMHVLEINEKIKSLSKEIKDIKKKPHENLEDRNTSAKKKNPKNKISVWVQQQTGVERGGSQCTGQ